MNKRAFAPCVITVPYAILLYLIGWPLWLLSNTLGISGLMLGGFVDIIALYWIGCKLDARSSGIVRHIEYRVFLPGALLVLILLLGVLVFLKIGC